MILRSSLKVGETVFIVGNRSTSANILNGNYCTIQSIGRNCVTLVEEVKKTGVHLDELRYFDPNLKLESGMQFTVMDDYVYDIPVKRGGVLELTNVEDCIYLFKIISGFDGSETPESRDRKNWCIPKATVSCKLRPLNLEIKEKTEEIKMNENKSNPVDALAKGLQDSLGGLVSTVLKDSQEKIHTDLLEFKTQIRKEFQELTENMPVMEIKLSDVKEIKKLSVKANTLLPRLIVNSKLGLYTMLVGPAGCGKTTLANQLAEALGVQFGAVCLTAGASETWLFGRQTANGFVEGPFAKLYKEGGVFLADEMDAADANLLLSMNTALSHDVFINPMNGETMKKHKNFIFVGAANTNGKGANHVYTGRTRLDAATLDRFIILEMDYDRGLEKSLCPDDNIYNFLNDIRKELKSKELDEFISTRSFKNLYLLHTAGIKYADLIDSLISNWGEVAKKVAKDLFEKTLSKVPEVLPEDSLVKKLGIGKKRGRRKITQGQSESSDNSNEKLIEEIKKIESSGVTDGTKTPDEIPF